MNQFEIFTVEADGLTKNAAIDILLGYPNAPTLTDKYRDLEKHPTQELWSGIVDDELTNACSSMSAEDRALYYNDSDLKNYQYLIDNGWLDIND